MRAGSAAERCEGDQGAAQKVLKIISSDKANTQTYCDIAKLDEQVAEADEKKSLELFRQMGELATKLGPEYIALMGGL